MQPLQKHFTQAMPDLGLGYLASVVQEQGHQVRMFIPGLSPQKEEYLRTFLREFRPDGVGIKIMACMVLHAQETIRIIKEVLPDSIIVLGGPMPSCDSENIFALFPDIQFYDYTKMIFYLDRFFYFPED